MPDGKKRDRPIEADGGNGEIKKPKINGLSSITSQVNKDRIAEAKARIAALAKNKEKNGNAGSVKSNGGTSGGAGGSTSDVKTNGATRSSTADLMAKIKERKAQLEAMNRQKGTGVRSESAPGSLKPPPPLAPPPPPPRAQQAPPRPARPVGLNTPVHPLLLNTKPIKSEKSDKPNIYLQEPTAPEPVNPYFDAQMSTGSNLDMRRKRGLAFNPKGKYIKKAEEERKQIQLEALKRKIEESKSKASNILEADILAGERLFKPSVPPVVEWWDESLVIDSTKGYANDNKSIDGNNAITIYIQHPIPINTPWEKNLPKQTKLHLTKKEIKRMRKNDRAERHKEAQDRIRLGLDPAPPPKIKPSNVMSVFTNEAIKDPTLMELRAKTEVAQRKDKHEEDNQSRKLTGEEKYEKWVAKSEREKAKGIYCAAFRIDNLSDGRHKFLVNYNAKHLQLTGMLILNAKFSLVVVEGGLLNIKKFSKLLLNRIKWTENAPPRDVDKERGSGGASTLAPSAPTLTPTLALPPPPPPPQDLSSNRCVLVWYGQIKSSRFQKWSIHDTETEQDSKDLLARHNCDSFWIEARIL